MSQNNRGYKDKNAFFIYREVSDLPENIGNKRTFEDIRIPPDNIGNKVDHDPIATFVHDGLGNSLNEEPAHLRSGILSYLFDKKERYFSRRPMRDPQVDKSHFDLEPNMAKKEDLNGKNGHLLKADEDITSYGNDYMERLVKEFTQLLALKSGLPFSFSTKPITDVPVDEISQRQNLIAIKLLIEEILKASTISASVSFSEYRSNKHYFSVFSVNPAERDPIKNKELISALRQVIVFHVARFLPESVNVLLVLANAQSVIENHLYKIGAKKIEH